MSIWSKASTCRALYSFAVVQLCGYILCTKYDRPNATTDSFLSPRGSLSKAEWMKLEAPSIYYFLSGNLRLSYKLHKDFQYGDYKGALIKISENETIYSEPLSFSSKSPWGTIELPCSTFSSPGVYTFHISPTGTTEAVRIPEIVSNIIEIRWLESIKWFLSARDVKTFSQPLIANVSLYTQTACPQQEPANVSLSVNLHFITPTTKATEVVTTRRLVWPFGTIRSPINSSVQFPCQSFDRPGSYYTSLSLAIHGRQIMLDRSPSINASRRLSDYSVHVMGEHINKCINTPKADDGVRVSYKAPQCVGNDKLRLYMVKRNSFRVSTYKGINIDNFEQVYLMEKSIRSRPRFASFHFPCHIFSSHRADALGFCFVYTTISRDGQSNELPETRQCFPVSDAGQRVWKWGQRAEWSAWSSWTPCTQTCRKGHEDISVRMRYRKCMIAANESYGQLCLGKGLETMECNVPRCTVYDTKDSKEANVIIWFPNSNLDGEKTTERRSYLDFGILDFYTNWKSTTNNFLEADDYFVPVVISAAVFVILLLISVSCPRYCRICTCSAGNPQRKKAQNATKNSDRGSGDSGYILISKDDEPRNKNPNTANLSCYDARPSRSGAVEMRTFPVPMNPNQLLTTTRTNVNTLPKLEEWEEMRAVTLHKNEMPRKNEPSDSATWQKNSQKCSPAIHTIHRGNRLSEGGSTDSPRSSRSQASSRPETGDVQDLEYDDFIAEPIDDEDHSWPAQKLDIQVFATAYEEILNELNGARVLEAQYLESSPTDPTDGEKGFDCSNRL